MERLGGGRIGERSGQLQAGRRSHQGLQAGARHRGVRGDEDTDHAASAARSSKRTTVSRSGRRPLEGAPRMKRKAQRLPARIESGVESRRETAAGGRPL